MPLWIRDKIYLDFRYKGRRFRPSTGMNPTDANIKLANQWSAAIKHEIRACTFRIENHFPNFRPSNQRAVQRDETFTRVATDWLEAHQQTWAEWTYRKFKADLTTRVFPKIGGRNVKELTGKDLRLLREAILAQGRIGGGGKLSNRSVNHIMQPVKAIFNELFADGEITQNPGLRLGRLKEKRIAEIDPFSDEEIELLLKKVIPWYRPYVEFLFESGFRPNEAMALKWSNVNLVTLVLSVRHGRVLGKDKDPKTESAIRDVDITSGILNVLKRQKVASYLANSYVFVTETGQPLDLNNFRSYIWQPALKKAGLKYRYPYQARHTFATKGIREGRDPFWIANQMGTSLDMLFKHYAVYFRKKRLSHLGLRTETDHRNSTKQ